MRTWTKRQRLTDQKWEVICDGMPDAEIAFWGPRAEAVAQFIINACNAAEKDERHWHLTTANNSTGEPYAYSCGGSCRDGYATGEEALKAIAK